MKVFVFSGSGERYGFTQDEAGSNLPSEDGPWVFFKNIDMNHGETPRVGVNTEEALKDIEGQGYHVTSTGVRFEVC